MPFILTLVSSDKPLCAGHLAGMERFAELQGIDLSKAPLWLAPHKAAEIGLSTCLNPGQMAQLRDALHADKIDVFCSPAKNRRKKLLLADMDSTIVDSETLDELAGHIGIKDKVAAITARAMNGEIEYQASLKERVALLKNLPEEALKQTLEATRISSGAKTVVKTMRKHGALCVLVSSGFTFFTASIAGQCGFSQHHGNVLEIKNGKLTGKVHEPILDKNAKLSYLHHYKRNLDLGKEDTLAIGDGANDLPMLEAAGLGVGYHPKPVLQAALQNCIIHGNLAALLYVQGYREEEISA